MFVFFSPSGVKSLFTNFPDFEQGRSRDCYLWSIYPKSS
jgi:uroporphyrinogen-III synthase